MRIEYDENPKGTCIFEDGEKEEIRCYVMDEVGGWTILEIDKMTKNVIERMIESGESKEEALAWCREFC